jgi:hypothetical protein
MNHHPSLNNPDLWANNEGTTRHITNIHDECTVCHDWGYKQTMTNPGHLVPVMGSGRVINGTHARLQIVSDLDHYFLTSSIF